MSWVLDPVHSSVEFAVKHMVIATVKGRFTRFEVDGMFDLDNPERSTVEARIDAASVDTRDPQRDGHLRSPDFFDVEQHPWITFRSRRIERSGDGSYAVVGDLTIRGVTREVVLEATFAGLAKDPWGSQRAGVAAETSVNRKDFGLTWNVPLEAGGLLVGDNVKISLDVEFVKQG